jgi:hypothetical protein
MLSAWSIRKFLLRQPHAREIRVVRDGDVQLVTRSGNWSKTADTLRAMQPDLIELLDEHGTVIRATRPGEENDPTETAPEVPQILSTDPNAAMLSHFANLIHRAYEHSTTVAFAKMVELVERIDNRSDAIESRLERTERAYRQVVQQQIDDAYERAEELSQDTTGDLGNTLIRTFAQSAEGANGKGRA